MSGLPRARPRFDQPYGQPYEASMAEAGARRGVAWALEEGARAPVRPRACADLRATLPPTQTGQDLYDFRTASGLPVLAQLGLRQSLRQQVYGCSDAAAVGDTRFSPSTAAAPLSPLAAAPPQSVRRAQSPRSPPLRKAQTVSHDIGSSGGSGEGRNGGGRLEIPSHTGTGDGVSRTCTSFLPDM